MTRPGIEPRSPGPLANTLTARPMSGPHLRTNSYLLRTFCPHLGSFFFFLCVFSSFTTFRPHFTSDFLQVIFPRPQIGMISLVTVFPVITAFHSCCLSHHVFDQVNLWPAWVGFETAIFWQCSLGTVETERIYPLRHGPRRSRKNHLKKARREMWLKRSERRNNTKKLPRWGQKVRNK